MRTLGLLGGMTYHSTLLYYQHINAHIQARLGSPAASSLILHSFNFADMAALFASGQWNTVTSRFLEATNHMQAAGAQGVAIGCNIGHRVAADLQARTDLPVLHISRFTAAAVKVRGLKTVALLATKEATEGEFIRTPLREWAGADVLVPEQEDVEAINAAIFRELSAGVVTAETRERVRRVVRELVSKGAEGVVLACTDLQMVLGSDKEGEMNVEDVDVPVLDTLELHARGLAEWALNE